MRSFIKLFVLVQALTCHISCSLLYSGSSDYSNNTVDVCYYKDGYWGNWHSDYKKSRQTSGTNQNFVLHNKYGHPSDYTIKIDISSPLPSDDVLQKQWVVRSGLVTAYVRKGISSRREQNLYIIQNFGNVENVGTFIKVTRSATIKIKIFRKGRICYNIYFDDVGIGIDMPKLK